MAICTKCGKTFKQCTSPQDCKDNMDSELRKQEPVPVILSLKGNETRAIPDTCTLAKYLVDSLRYNGKHPCDGCTENRMVCHGHARKATSRCSLA